jgi:hypothetical protein
VQCLRPAADPHPGNIAVDAEAGGRLIYYDFGMMGAIPGDVRAGLLELFYGVYQKDPDRCIDALVQMGVLVPGGDRVAIRRTAVFFLKSFEVGWGGGAPSPAQLLSSRPPASKGRSASPSFDAPLSRKIVCLLFQF